MSRAEGFFATYSPCPGGEHGAPGPELSAGGAAGTGGTARPQRQASSGSSASLAGGVGRWRPASLLLPIALAAALLGGCVANPPAPQPPALAQADRDLADVSARVDVLISTLDRIATLAGREADALVDAAKSQAARIGEALTAMRSNISELERQVTALAGDRQAARDELARLEGTYGVRIERWIRRVLWILIALQVLHLVGGVAALFIPGPVGATIAVISAAVNPLSWFQTIRDNIFFRRQAAQVNK